MHFVSSFLFSVSANVDNLAVGIAYGVKKLKISLGSSFLIAFMSCVGTFVSMVLGKLLLHVIPRAVENYLGSFILIGLGIWSLYISLKHRKEKNPGEESNILNPEELMDEPEIADLDHSGYIDVKEALVLGFALAVNNLGMGIGASITGLNVLITSSMTFILSFIFITAGRYMGEYCLSELMGRMAGIISGLVIILLGIYEILI